MKMLDKVYSDRNIESVCSHRPFTDKCMLKYSLRYIRPSKKYIKMWNIVNPIKNTMNKNIYK